MSQFLFSTITGNLFDLLCWFVAQKFHWINHWNIITNFKFLRIFSYHMCSNPFPPEILIELFLLPSENILKFWKFLFTIFNSVVWSFPALLSWFCDLLPGLKDNFKSGSSHTNFEPGGYEVLVKNSESGSFFIWYIVHV